MEDVHLDVLHAAVVGVLDDHHLIGQLGQSTPLGTHQCDGLDPLSLCVLERLHQVGRIAADAGRDEHVAFAGVVGQLPRKDLVVGVVVSEGRHPGDVVGQRQHPESARQLVAGPLAQIDREVTGVGRAATIANGEDLLVARPGRTERLHQGGDLSRLHGIHGPLLGIQIVSNPLCHHCR